MTLWNQECLICQLCRIWWMLFVMREFQHKLSKKYVCIVILVLYVKFLSFYKGSIKTLMQIWLKVNLKIMKRANKCRKVKMETINKSYWISLEIYSKYSSLHAFKTW